jgi:serine/threonine protein kinase
MSLQDNMKFGNYTLKELKGKGSTAEVWSAIDSNGKLHALKIFDKIGFDESLVRLLKAEFEKVKHIRHPNLLIPNELYEVDDQYYLKMELCDTSIWHIISDGLNDQALIKQIFDETALFKHLKDLTEALIELKNNRLLHNDIKPANILVKYDNNAIKFLLTDFGGIKEVRDTIRKDNSDFLTIFYAAPEKILGSNPTEFSDIFSLGASFYELIKGKQERSFADQLRTNELDFSNMGSYSYCLIGLLSKMLEQNASNRWSLEKILEYCNQYLNKNYQYCYNMLDHKIEKQKPTLTERADFKEKVKPGKKKILKIVGLSALILLLGAISFLIFQNTFNNNILNRYDNYIYVNQKYILVQKDGAIGVVNKKGEIVKELNFDFAKIENDRIILYSQEEQEILMIK